MALRIGVIQAVMDFPPGVIYEETKKYIERSMKINATYEYLTVEEVTEYTGSSDFPKPADLVLVPIETRIHFSREFFFTGTVGIANGKVISGPPTAYSRTTVSNMINIDIYVFLLLLSFSMIVGWTNSLIKKHLQINLTKNKKSLNHCNTSLMVKGGILFLLPVIQKPIPCSFVGRSLPSRVLLSFWLFGLSFIFFSFACNFKANSSVIEYAEVNYIPDVLQYKGCIPKLLYTGPQDVIIKEKASTDLSYKQVLKIIENPESNSYIEAMDLLDEEHYFSVTKRTEALMMGDIVYELACSLILKDIDRGKLQLYISNGNYLSFPLFYLVHRNISHAMIEELDRRIMRIFETKSFEFVMVQLRYAAYEKHKWEYPNQYNMSLRLSDFYFTFAFALTFFSGSVLVLFFEFWFGVKLLRKARRRRANLHIMHSKFRSSQKQIQGTK